MSAVLTAGQVDLSANRFASFAYDAQWNSYAGGAVPLAGYSACMKVRTAKTSTATLVAFFTSGAGGTSGCSIAIGSGLVSVTATPAATGAINAGTYFYDLIMKDATGKETRLLEGSFFVVEGVTDGC